MSESEIIMAACGDNYDVLYVTSQQLFMTPEELEASPQAGNLFAGGPGTARTSVRRLI